MHEADLVTVSASFYPNPHPLQERRASFTPWLLFLRLTLLELNEAPVVLVWSRRIALGLSLIQYVYRRAFLLAKYEN